MNKLLIRTAIAIALQPLIAPAFARTHTQADTMFKSADSADVSENYTVASAKYLDVISKLRQSDPANLIIIRAQARLARIYIFQKDFDKAEPIFHILIHTDHRQLDLEPELMIDLDDLSDAYANLHGDPRHGLECLEHCMALRKHISANHPRLPDAYRQLSECCASRRNAKEAIEWILKAIEIEKHYPLSKQVVLIRDKTYLASIYLAGNDLDKAKETAEEALDTVTKHGGGRRLIVQLHTTLGRVYSKKGLLDQAEKEYQLALKNIDPTDKNKKAIVTCITGFRQQNELLGKKTRGGRH